MTFRNHQKLRPQHPKCLQCGTEPRLLGRADGLGVSCGAYADDAVAKQESAKAAKEKKK